MTERSQAHATQARQDLERAVAALRDSDAWRRNLAVMATFHRYSFHNQLLIGCQKPDASFVRGFKSWIDAGRCVRKGEKGIRIYAPRPWQRADSDETGEEHVERGVSFAVVHVFDVSQTDPIPGHPNPWQPPVRYPASGDESIARTLWDAMLAHAGALGLTVSTSENDPLASPDMFGYFHHSARTVWIRPGRDRADMAATFAHELAHAITHDATTSMSRDVREVVAESVAYVVCSRFGLDLELRSPHYVADWLDDPDAFRAGMAAIHDAAAAFIDAIETETLAADALAVAA